MNKNIEIWKPVLVLFSRDSKWNLTDRYVFPKGLYYVSNMGRFRVRNKIKETKPDSVMTITYCLNGHRFKLHEIILQTFMPEGNIDGFSPDHINKKKRLDNRLCNLRWADHRTQYANRENKKYKFKKVFCKEKGIVYDSCQQAEKSLGLTFNTVSRVARGDRKSIHGFTFVFV
jgi:hypothetical protein